MNSENVFTSGNEWLRVDFHLHTRADKEFSYGGDENDFVNQYVSKLKSEDIRLACITNHNKFDWDEYKGIAKKARKSNIHVLPGVELSVDDGSKAIHCLVIFDPKDWLSNGYDVINEFISSCFKGKAKQDYENENGSSDQSLTATLKELELFDRSYFIVLAHVDQNSGFFKVMDGGKIKKIATDQNFQRHVLGLQKAHSRDNISNLREWAPHYSPALVEGSDAKSIDQIGKGKHTYLKLGSFDFEAIKYALTDHHFRVANEIPEVGHGYVKSIEFTGGKLDGQTITFNDGMTNLIGIRGSGKSSILEALRYALDIDITKSDNEDYKYKSQLINELLSSGGEMKTTMLDEHGEVYLSKKRIGEQSTLYHNGVMIDNLKPTAIVRKPIYYGQKDLSKIGDALSTESLINRLVGNKTAEIKKAIEEKKDEIIDTRDRIIKISTKLKTIDAVKEKKADLLKKIKIFKDHKIDDKLEKQILFDKDITYVNLLDKNMSSIISQVEAIVSDAIDIYELDRTHTSKYNSQSISEVEAIYHKFVEHFEKINEVIESMTKTQLSFRAKSNTISLTYQKMQDEFAEIKRAIDLPNIQADDYVTYSKSLDRTDLHLKELDKIKDSKNVLEKELQTSLKQLQDFWAQEYRIISEEVDKVNKDQSAISIDMKFRGNKTAFSTYLKDTLRGSNISTTKINEIAENNVDLIELYTAIKKGDNSLKSLLSDTQYVAFIDIFKKNMSAYLTYRVPDLFDIKYQGRSISDHSLGQRASALIVFILSLKESEIIIIDQPEDDLDNQTIYNDVIKSLKALKSTTQFVFATHNPNIPVLGDADQVIACEYDDNKIKVVQGSIDEVAIRERIVDVMEGGEDAFNKRKEIYELWTV